MIILALVFDSAGILRPDGDSPNGFLAKKLDGTPQEGYPNGRAIFYMPGDTLPDLPVPLAEP